MKSWINLPTQKQREAITALLMELLDKYETAETSVIHERSGSIEWDLALLEEEVKEYEARIIEILAK